MIPSEHSNEYDKLVRDVCNIFGDVTGAIADPLKEWAVIIPFAKEFQWSNYEFRLIIEWSWRDPKNREFLMRPGFTNLRTIFNPARKGLLSDVCDDLKRQKEIQNKQSQVIDEISDIKINRIPCKCGQVLEVRFLKIPCAKTERNVRGFEWKQDYQQEYENHYTDALFNGWSCVWPTWYKEKHFSEEYLNKMRASLKDPTIFFNVMNQSKNGEELLDGKISE